MTVARSAADVTSVVAGGRQIVRDGHHLLVGAVPAALARALAALDRPSRAGTPRSGAGSPGGGA